MPASSAAASSEVVILMSALLLPQRWSTADCAAGSVQRRSGTMMRGAPGGGAVGAVVPADEPIVPELLPMLPVVDDEPRLSEPTVPVVGAGMPALPTPVPKLGVTVVLPAPEPPGMPAPDDVAGAP